MRPGENDAPAYRLPGSVFLQVSGGGGGMNPRKGCPFTRFRVLRTTVHHRPPASLTSADRQSVSTGERPGTEVNETQTEPQTLSRR